jgi:hypothetical protein
MTEYHLFVSFQPAKYAEILLAVLLAEKLVFD